MPDRLTGPIVHIPWLPGIDADGLTAGERVDWVEVEARRVAMERDREEQRRGLCPEEFGDNVICELPVGHSGDHLETGEGWEMRWRPTA